MAPDAKQEYKKYLILTAEQLRRLRGVDPMRSKLDTDRDALLRQATKKGSTGADIAMYQDALRRHVAYKSLEEEKPLSVDLVDPAALAAATAGASGTKDAATGPDPKPTPRRPKGTPRGPRYSTRPRHKSTQTGTPRIGTPRSSKWLPY